MEKITTDIYSFLDGLAAKEGEFVVLVDEYDVPLQGFFGNRAALLRVREIMHDFYLGLMGSQLTSGEAKCILHNRHLEVKYECDDLGSEI